MHIAVLGSGPAALAALHGATLSSSEPLTYDIWTNRDAPSRLNGCQYLHAMLPGMGDPTPQPVHYSLRGTREQYARKVYGPRYTGQVSVDDYEGHHMAWDLRSAYVDLWHTYVHGERNMAMHYVTATPDWLAVAFPWEGYDHVISTIPAQQLCVRDCTFASEEVWAAGDAPGLQELAMGYLMDDNAVECNGEENPSWYRRAKVFGHATVEWPGTLARVFSEPPAVRVVKPLFTNCVCWQTFGDRHLIRVGRYGQWQKRAYVHDAFRMGSSLVSHGLLSLYPTTKHESLGMGATAPDGVEW